MLRTLRIRDFVIVEELTVEFGPGLNLLTGETGAGKSILVDALGLIAIVLILLGIEGQLTDPSAAGASSLVRASRNKLT